MVKRKRIFARRTRFGGEMMRLKRTRRRAPRAIPVKLVRRRRGAPRRNKAGILPDRKIATLRYVDHFLQNADTSLTVTQWRANSLFDPDLTGVGHQPRGFDQWMTLYQKYAVLSSTITVRAWSRSSLEPVAFSIQTSETGITNDLNLIDMMENNPRTTRLGCYRADGGGHRGMFLRTSVNVAKFLNRSGGIADDPDLQGDVTANPAKQITYFLNSVRVGSVNGGAVAVVLSISYRVMFLEPHKHAVS